MLVFQDSIFQWKAYCEVIGTLYFVTALSGLLSPSDKFVVLKRRGKKKVKNDLKGGGSCVYAW